MHDDLAAGGLFTDSRDNQHTLGAEGKLVWPASEILCQYICHLSHTHPNLFRGKKILEVGSGQGLVGMTASLFSSSPPILTDYDEDAIELLEANLSRNFKDDDAGRPITTKLTWGDEKSMDDLSKKHGDHFDFIVGSDIVYYRTAVVPLLQTVRRFLTPQITRKVEEGSVFILCNQRARLCVNHDLFFDTVKELGLHIEETNTSQISLDSFLPPDKIPLEKTHLFLIFRQ
ncbi:hypothetical protein PROFUN_02378 [Planoprotostelium fungivorum]|uniref:Uncharacterized protein n=1 Tax=Planoprotostelium fungivorum TaxID=1890364 RepID=A0A2P6NUY6_9EUKA|nr:hypothetical protein PROFUN_02378 [Planoprotostelium fungivorum]